MFGKLARLAEANFRGGGRTLPFLSLSRFSDSRDLRGEKAPFPEENGVWPGAEITTNPAEAVKTFNVEKEARDVFTYKQLAAILRVAPTEWKTALLLAYYGGLRLSETVLVVQRKEQGFPKTQNPRFITLRQHSSQLRKTTFR